MADYKSTELTALDADGLINFNEISGKFIAFKATVAMASQASGKTIELARVPEGYIFDHGYHVTDTTLGSATVAYGTSDSAAKYKAAAVFTDTETPTMFGNVASMVELDAEETIIATIAADALPASGSLIVTFVFRKYT